MTNFKKSLAKRFKWLSVAAPGEAAPALIAGRFRLATKNDIETDVKSDKLDALFDRTARTWQMLGETRPHWSVLAWDDFAKENFDVEGFYRTGQHDLSVLKAFFDRSGRSLSEIENVCELGCGVGRVTEWLAKEVQQVTAIDISPPHIEIARQRMENCGRANVTFTHLRTIGDLLALPRTNLFYSVIVLQHNPPPVIVHLLDRLLDKVEIGGYAFFQVPTLRTGYQFTLDEYMQSEAGEMEMHVLPQKRIFQQLDRSGFRLLEIQEDDATGNSNMMSNTFFAERVRL